MLSKECSENNHWCQMVTEEVLGTVLIDSEGILNSKPFGYVFSPSTLLSWDNIMHLSL